MVAVVVDPLVQKVPNRQTSDLGMTAGTHQDLGSQRSDQLEAVAPQRLELTKQLVRPAFAVAPRFFHGRLIPALELGIVGAEDDPDPARERALLSLDDVPDAFVHAPLAVGGMPCRRWRLQRPERAGVRLPRGFEDFRHLVRGHPVVGTSRVTGFSIRRLTSAMNWAAVAP